MSRTDVHRPWRVQLDDPYNRHRLVRFSWHLDEMIPVYNTCGCPMCTERYTRRLAHKQERVAWRKVRQDLVKLQDHEDVDVGPIRGSAWG
jgi:hypothetical protein